MTTEFLILVAFIIAIFLVLVIQSDRDYWKARSNYWKDAWDGLATELINRTTILHDRNYSSSFQASANPGAGSEVLPLSAAETCAPGVHACCSTASLPHTIGGFSEGSCCVRGKEPGNLQDS